LKNNINIKAKKINNDNFEVVFEMNRQAIEKRLKLICGEIKGLRISKEKIEKQLELLICEKSQIELSLTQK
jgi:hypothetical protein